MKIHIEPRGAAVIEMGLQHEFPTAIGGTEAARGSNPGTSHNGYCRPLITV